MAFFFRNEKTYALGSGELADISPCYIERKKGELYYRPVELDPVYAIDSLRKDG